MEHNFSEHGNSVKVNFGEHLNLFLRNKGTIVNYLYETREHAPPPPEKFLLTIFTLPIICLEYPTKIFCKLLFQISPGDRSGPKRSWRNAYAKFWWVNNEYYGKIMAMRKWWIVYRPSTWPPFHETANQEYNFPLIFEVRVSVVSKRLGVPLLFQGGKNSWSTDTNFCSVFFLKSVMR